MLIMAYFRPEPIFRLEKNLENLRKIKGLRFFLTKRLYCYYTAKIGKSKAL